MSKGLGYGLINYGYWHQSPQISQQCDASQITAQKTGLRQALIVSNIVCQGKGDSLNVLSDSINESGPRGSNTSRGITSAQNNDKEAACQLPGRDEEPLICHDWNMHQRPSSPGVLIEPATGEHETPTSKLPSGGDPDRVSKHINNNVRRKESRLLLVHKMLSEAPSSTRQDFMKGVTYEETDDPLLTKIYQRELSAKKILDPRIDLIEEIQNSTPRSKSFSVDNDSGLASVSSSSSLQ